MNKKELIDSIAAKTDLPKKEVERVLQGLAATAAEQLSMGREFTLPDIGKIKVVDVPERLGRNPATGQPIQIAAHRKVKFNPTQAVKDVVR